MKWYEDAVYIKMSDCEEIQSLWRHSEGDWFYAKEDLGDGNDRSFIRKGTVTCSGEIGDYGWGSDCDYQGVIENFNDAIWLPTQAQLQRTVFDSREIAIPTAMIRLLNDWWQENTTGHITSMEQLWLAFVMKGLHNKVWDGEKWQLAGQ